MTAIYREASLRVCLEDGVRVLATAYIVDRSHGQYAGKLSQETILTHVSQGVGLSGANIEYVFNTQRHLAEMGIRDNVLQSVVDQLIIDDNGSSLRG